jgi:hypothetical protein
MLKDELDKMGGDWAGWGVQTWAQFVAQAKPNILLATDGIRIEVTTKSGQTGIYNIKHTDLANF